MAVESCPICGGCCYLPGRDLTEGTCYGTDPVQGGVAVGGWSGGKCITQLHPRDPKRWVTSFDEAVRVCKARGLDPDGGRVIDPVKFEKAKQAGIRRDARLNAPREGARAKYLRSKKKS